MQTEGRLLSSLCYNKRDLCNAKRSTGGARDDRATNSGHNFEFEEANVNEDTEHAEPMKYSWTDNKES